MSEPQPQPDSSSQMVIVLVQAGKFPLGQLCATPGALEAVSHVETALALNRHISGDWGELDPEDKQANDRALQDGSRLVSAYTTAAGIRFWIITEWDRSATTILLPQEY